MHKTQFLSCIFMSSIFSQPVHSRTDAAAEGNCTHTTSCYGYCGGHHGNIITYPRRMWGAVRDAVKRHHARVKLAVMQCCRSIAYSGWLLSTNSCPVNRRCLSVTDAAAFTLHALLREWYVECSSLAALQRRTVSSSFVDWFISARYLINTCSTRRTYPSSPTVLLVYVAFVVWLIESSL